MRYVCMARGGVGIAEIGGQMVDYATLIQVVRRI